MTVVSIPSNEPRRVRRRSRAARALSGLLVVLSTAGMIGIAPLGLPSPAVAAPTSSALSISWNGDDSVAARFQPTRLPASAHFNDFDDLTVTVSQTTGLVDQTVRVSVSGFAPTRAATMSRNDIDVDNAMNYIQAMQCWGPDPLAADFNETCQWGGRFGDGGGLGRSVVLDNAARVGELDLDASRPTSHDVPFRTAGGTRVSGKPQLVDGNSTYPILSYFGPSTTNEVTSARIGTDGSGYFDFETQSSSTAPQLGCGARGQLRCWLVIVPRGSHFGGEGLACSGIRDRLNDHEPYSYGRPNSIQGGSPVNDQCDYFENRIVVPLDFLPTGVSCTVGSTETRVVGSQLMTAAMSSWQPALCQSLATTFSFATNGDAVSRSQLIDTGTRSPNIAYTGFPVSSGELPTDRERTELARTKLSYAPVAISAVVVGFVAEFNDGRQERLVLSPRLLAKYLTQSYPFLVPQSTSSQGRNATHLGAVNRSYALGLYQDPEFQALNPTNYNQFQYAPALIVPGANADAIKQVWRWILADADAKAFLEGVADPWGMTVNPYYLPSSAANTVPWYLDDAKQYLEEAVTKPVGLTNIDGTPRKLTDRPLENFPKYDQTLMPLQLLSGERSRFDSIQFAPYAESFLAGARQTFRADSRSKVFWDPNITNGIGERGDWISSGPQLPGQKLMLVITDSVSAARWGLSVARLTEPDTIVTRTTVPSSINSVVFSDDAMASALSALEATSLDTVKQVNPATVPAAGWPMTIVTYAGVNLTKSTPAARVTIADMLKQVTTSGQVPGTAPGELPVGYLPLTSELVTQAAASVTEIRNYVAPSPSPTPKPANAGFAQDDYDAAATSGSGAGDAEKDPAVTDGVDQLSADRTAVSSTEPIMRSGLVIALVIGLAGLLIAPILFRGRGLL